MTRRRNLKLLGIAVLVVMASGYATAAPTVDGRGYVTLSEQPAITFQTSGWSYTSTENPFILTADYLTNAMVGFSRLQSGEPVLRGGPPVPEELNENTIKRIFEEKLGSESSLEIRTQHIGSRSVVVASYGDEEKSRQEYGFELGGALLHVIVVANHGQYAREAEQVARTAIETMEHNANRR